MWRPARCCRWGRACGSSHGFFSGWCLGGPGVEPWEGELPNKTGWWYTYPSEKYESQLGWLFPIYGIIKFKFQTTNQKKLTSDDSDGIDQLISGTNYIQMTMGGWNTVMAPWWTSQKMYFKAWRWWTWKDSTATSTEQLFKNKVTS